MDTPDVKETPKIGSGLAGPGRPKGVPNKTTTLLKDSILLAARRAGGDTDEGISNYLEAQAKENPGPFMALLGKVLPLTVAGDKDSPVYQVTSIRLCGPDD